MKHHRLVSAALIAIALCAGVVQAQSGRRQSKPAPAAPVPTPTPEPTPVPKKEEKEPGILLFVAFDRSNAHAYFPLYFYDAVLNGCGERLRTSSADVEVSNNDLGRGDAIKKAKSGDGIYVVLLSLTVDTMSRSFEDVDVNYVVFAPETAKVVTTGRAYQRAVRTGPVVVSPSGRGSTSPIYREQMLRQAGEDAAERILKALNLPVRK